MTRRLLLILAAVQRPGNEHYRLIKYFHLTVSGLVIALSLMLFIYPAITIGTLVMDSQFTIWKRRMCSIGCC